MNVWKKIPAALLTVLGVFSAWEMSAAEKGQLSQTDQVIVQHMELRGQEIEHRATRFVQEGNALVGKKDYTGAIKKFLKAKELFAKYPTPSFQEKIEFCQKEIAACYYENARVAMGRAEKAATTQDFDEAIRLCKEAIKYCPEQVAELESRVELYEKRRERVLENNAASADILLPNRESQQYQIQVLLEQGRRLVLAKDYSGAQKKFEDVLLLDPYNADAAAARRGLNKRISDAAQLRYGDMHRKTMAEIEWKYAVPFMPEASGNGENALTGGQPRPTNAVLSKSPMMSKLEKIFLPKSDFTNVPVAAVIRSLHEQSRLKDPAKVGVNLIYIPAPRKMDDSTVGGEGKSSETKKKTETPVKTTKKKTQKADDENEEESSDDEDAEESEENSGPRVNLQIADRTNLYDALTKLCASGDLEFQLEDHAVIINPSGIALAPMEPRYFSVNADSAGGGDPTAVTESYKRNLTMLCGKNVFPAGSTISYNPSSKKLCVTNTVENLELIGNALENLQKIQPQVQILLKLLDINQNDLDQLAFNWQLQVNANQAVEANGGGWRSSSSTDTNPQLTSKYIQGQNSPLTRYYSVYDKSFTSPSSINDSLLSWVWANDSGTKLIASMFALNQSDSKDALQSPRVTVKSGEMAEINMVAQHHYPAEEWNTIDGISTADSYLKATAQPDLSEEQELGIKFKVQPQVDETDRKISLDVDVNFMTFVGYDTYDTRTYDADDPSQVEDGNYYQMPVFNSPTIKSRLTVYDGETVIVGGIIHDESESINDKIPVLGDLPFVGRFFQSKGTKSVKRNLLVFISCRLVKPDGSPQYPDEVRSHGIPRFSRGL